MKFMAEHLGIEISIITPAMVTTVQNYVKDLNDHVRFLDSGAISAKANNARKPEVVARFIQSILASPMGVQQQEITGDAVIAGIAPEQVGSDVGTAPGANGDAAVAAATASELLPPPRRESQLPSQLRDGSIVLLGANAGARIRNTAKDAIKATAFKLEQLINKDGRDLGTRYPSILTLLPQMKNQCDLAVELCTILYLELEAAMEELKKLEVMVQDFNRVAPSILEASNALMFQLASYKCTINNALEVGGDIQGTAGGATDAIAWASIAAGGFNPGENPDREERQPSSLPSTPVGSFLQLRGDGYFGGITTIHRIDIEVTGQDVILGIVKINKKESMEVKLPLGSYFLLNELFHFFGTSVNLSDKPYSTWKGWVSALYLHLNASFISL